MYFKTLTTLCTVLLAGSALARVPIPPSDASTGSLPIVVSPDPKPSQTAPIALPADPSTDPVALGTRPNPVIGVPISDDICYCPDQVTTFLCNARYFLDPCAPIGSVGDGPAETPVNGVTKTMAARA